MGVSACSRNSTTYFASVSPVVTSLKKGLGLTEKGGFGADQLNLLGISWYYNWGFTTGVSSKAEFIPMVFSLNTISQISQAKIILGYNEPDNVNQSNIAVGDAVSNWPALVSRSQQTGSPAMAGNPSVDGSWLLAFMSQKVKVDFITIHWYKGCDPQKFMADITAVIQKYNLPVWVTEYAPQTVSDSNTSPQKYSQAQVTAFINATTSWMNTQPMVARYAWHDSKTGTSAIFTSQGTLTSTGIAYRDAR